MFYKPRDHIKEARKTLSPHIRKPGTLTLLGSLVQHSQELEIILVSLLNNFHADSSGPHLERVARVVDVKRLPDESDESLRLRVKTEIAVMNSTGTIPDLINIINLLSNDYRAKIQEFPGSIHVEISFNLSQYQLSEVREILDRARCAGVKISRISYADNPLILDDSEYCLDVGTLTEESFDDDL